MAAHRYWRLYGVTAAAGHGGDGFGLNSLDWLASGVSLLPATLSASSDAGGTWNLAEATQPNASGVGWYSNNPYAGQWIACDFGAPVDPDQFTFCCLSTYPWTVGAVMDVQYSDDGAAWTHQRFVNPANADNTVQTFSVAAPPLEGDVSALAMIAPTSGLADAHIAQMALVAICNETPPVSGGARMSAFAIVTISTEYTIPKIYIPVPLGGFMQTMPYYVGEF